MPYRTISSHPCQPHAFVSRIGNSEARNLTNQEGGETGLTRGALILTRPLSLSLLLCLLSNHHPLIFCLLMRSPSLTRSSLLFNSRRSSATTASSSSIEPPPPDYFSVSTASSSSTPPSSISALPSSDAVSRSPLSFPLTNPSPVLPLRLLSSLT
ncbi:hypothetical protein BDY24DRAFT_138085 [Mrakia frigida]|uniref:uncharacterized protein n=1 Tax=Mrakia frigida TaxID=29902 RepID=UPI003FCC1955